MGINKEEQKDIPYQRFKKVKSYRCYIVVQKAVSYQNYNFEHGQAIAPTECLTNECLFGQI